MGASGCGSHPARAVTATRGTWPHHAGPTDPDPDPDPDSDPDPDPDPDTDTDTDTDSDTDPDTDTDSDSDSDSDTDTDTDPDTDSDTDTASGLHGLGRPRGLRAGLAPSAAVGVEGERASRRCGRCHEPCAWGRG